MLVQHATPSTLEESHSQLLPAGSKITFTDIYNKEMEIPLVREILSRRWRDNTFILLNGVWPMPSTSVSKQTNGWFTGRNYPFTGWTGPRKAEQASMLDDSERSNATAQADQLRSSNERENDLKTLAIASKKKITHQDQLIQQSSTKKLMRWVTWLNNWLLKSKHSSQLNSTERKFHDTSGKTK